MNGESPRRKAAVWVGAVFLLGAALGGVLGYGYAVHKRPGSGAPRTEEARRAQRADQLTREVGLSTGQRQKLDAIIANTHAQMKGIHQQADLQIDEARQKARNQIRAILTPEQIPKFEEFVRRLDEERKRNSQ
jgi:Spy/CpxP family protein refolding chaperone